MTAAGKRLRIYDAGRNAVLANLEAPSRAMALRMSRDGRRLDARSGSYRRRQAIRTSGTSIQVADAVMRGESAEELLDRYASSGSGSGSPAVQRKPNDAPSPQQPEGAHIDRLIQLRAAQAAPTAGHDATYTLLSSLSIPEFLARAQRKQHHADGDFHCFAPWKPAFDSFAAAENSDAFATIEDAIFYASLRSSWGVLGLLSTENQFWLLPASRHRLLLHAALEVWPELDTVGARYYAAVQGGAAVVCTEQLALRDGEPRRSD